MLVLNTRLSLLASTLTVLAISSVSTTASAAAIGVRAKSDSAPPTSPGYDTSTQNPWHQDRPSDLGLPEGKEPDSVASRKGMGNGRAHTRSWTATWTGTWTSEWERPTGSDHPWHGGSLPLDSENPEDAQEETPSQDVEDPEETEELSRRSAHGRSGRHRRSSKRGSVTKYQPHLGRNPRSIALPVDHKEYVLPSNGSKRMKNSASARVARRADHSGTPGVINIMSHVNNAEPGKKVASLFLEGTGGANKDSAYILNASERNASKFYLVPATSSEKDSPAAGANRRRQEPLEKDILVNLRMDIENAIYCATYDPNPPEAEPLTMQDCMGDNSSGPGTNRNEHKSQMFSYNQESGIIRPMWYGGDSKADTADLDGSEGNMSSTAPASSPSSLSAIDGLSAAIPTSTLAAAEMTTPAPMASSSVSASVAEVSTDSLSPSPRTAAPAGQTASVSSRDSSSSAQNVTLVFVPISDVPSAAGSEDVLTTASPSSSASVAEMTWTKTETVTVTSAATAAAFGDDLDRSSSPTPAPSASESSSPSGRTMSPSPVAFTDDGAASTTTITISSTAGPAATASAGSLHVQVIGDDGTTVGDDDPFVSAEPSSSSEKPTPSAAEADPFPSMVSSPSASAEAKAMDPIAIASSVAQSESASASAASPTATPGSGSDRRGFNSRIARRDLLSPVSTAPYKWLFKVW